MKKLTRLAGVLFCCLYFLAISPTFSCSMCKITRDGKTIVGNNEDAWRTSSKIWFETGSEGKYGAAYLGYADGFPQGSINEKGRVLDGFKVYPRELAPNEKPGVNPIKFLKDIMRSCQTVEEVYDYAIQFNREVFNRGMFLFVDETGKYLIMEVDTMIIGNDDTYILSNSCPSITAEEDVNIARYKRGKEFIKQPLDASIASCMAVMDTMHECRERIGDGTLYTNIFDLQTRDITLYFYHDYFHSAKFNLDEELAKGNHTYQIPELFPSNTEYDRLVDYKTPLNHMGFNYYFVFCAGLFCLMFSTFFWNLEKKMTGKKNHISYFHTYLMLLTALLVYYLYILFRNPGIYYFSAPYYVKGETLLNLTSYIPFILLGTVYPLYSYIKQKWEQFGFKSYTNWVMTINGVNFVVLLVLFMYWGLFSVI